MQISQQKVENGNSSLAFTGTKRKHSTNLQFHSQLKSTRLIGLLGKYLNTTHYSLHITHYSERFFLPHDRNGDQTSFYEIFFSSKFSGLLLLCATSLLYMGMLVFFSFLFSPFFGCCFNAEIGNVLLLDYRPYPL